MTRTIAILLLSSLCVFAEPNDRAPVDAPYNRVFDPWHACMAAEDLANMAHQTLSAPFFLPPSTG